ncbi:MAG: copper-binding protein [Helicobacteraceae bacterium]|jgi:Cu(I)/Ag(I) efflux system protein CusF|nr:copper-binding protein [Helicobacteraceae bacterium]
MKKALVAMAIGALVSVASVADHQHETPSQQTVFTKGIVKGINLADQKITIEHESIPELSWSAMTMRFSFADASLIDGIDVGDKVDFSFVQSGRLLLLRTIAPAK